MHQVEIPIQDDFDIFWAAYPKRPGNPKKAARDVWNKLAKKGELPAADRVIRAARSYTMHCLKTKILNTEFVAHARTWLHQKRWEEWAPVESEPASAAATVAEIALPAGFESLAQRVIARFGASAWRAWFAKAAWLRDARGIGITVPTRFEAQKLEMYYAEAIEGMAGEKVWIAAVGPRDAIEPTQKERAAVL